MGCVEEDVDSEDVRQDDGDGGVDEDGRDDAGAGDVGVSFYFTVADAHSCYICNELMETIFCVFIEKIF